MVHTDSRSLGRPALARPVVPEYAHVLEALSNEASGMGEFRHAGIEGIGQFSEIRQRRHFLAGRERLAQSRRVRKKLYQRSVVEGYFEDVAVGVDLDGPAVGQGIAERSPFRRIQTEVVEFEPGLFLCGCHTLEG
jgi:hypothetical protein